MSSLASATNLFEDEDFPATEESLGRGKKYPPNVWVRPSELGLTQLFNEGVDPNDIIQGHVGDCWLMSAIGSLAKFPKFIQEVTFGGITEVSATGKYEIYLWDCVDEDWVCVVIDDRIPVDAETKRPLFARPCGNELWVILLEKAFAKYSYNGWRSMNGGQPACALQMLVGVRAYPRFNKRNDGKWSCKIATSKLRGDVYRRECRGAPDCGPVRSNEPTTRVATWMSPCHSPLGAQKLEDEELWWELVWCAQAGYLMGCMINSPTEESKTMNLVGHHMYSLLDIANEPAGIAGVRLVQLRNPWGSKEYNGPWCDGSPEWHTSDGKKIAEGVGQQDKSDGTFWMPWETFVLLFTFIEYVPARLNRYVGCGKEQRDVVGLGGFFDFKKQSESGDALQPILLSGRKGNVISWNLPSNYDSTGRAPWIGVFKKNDKNLLGEEWYYGHTEKRMGGIRWEPKYFPTENGEYDLAIFQDKELARITFELHGDYVYSREHRIMNW